MTIPSQICDPVGGGEPVLGGSVATQPFFDPIDAPERSANGPRVSVVIPTWNGARWLERCLPSLRAQRFRDFELLIVDNGSVDESESVVERCFPAARWIGLGRNRGFAGAVNAGIRAARGELVALLNNDTEVDPGWLEALVDALDRRPEVAFAASRMRDYECRQTIDGAGDSMNWYASPSKIGKGETDDGRFEEEREVFGACAGAALYRRSLFEQIGFFEESFFAYIEDVDLSFRAQLAGLRCLYVPKAVVYHVGGATAGRRSALALRLATRNQLLLVVRDFPWPCVLTKLPKVLYAQYWLARGALKDGHLGVVLAAYASFLWYLPSALAARRAIQARCRVSIADLERVMDRREEWESRRLRAFWRLRIADCGLRIMRRRCRSAEAVGSEPTIRNPQSAIE